MCLEIIGKEGEAAGGEAKGDKASGAPSGDLFLFYCLSVVESTILHRFASLSDEEKGWMR